MLEKLLPDNLGFLRDLIRTPSNRGEESHIQSKISRAFEKRGLIPKAVEICPQKLKNVPGFSPSETHYSGRPNIAAVLKGKGGGRSLILNFHIDTAPEGPQELWTREAGELIDGKIYGRGAWDDKAGAALAFLILDAIQNLKIELKGDLIFQSVIEDEHTGNGTLALIHDGFSADGAIVLDGAYDARAIIGHPGYTNFRVTVYGKAAPSCRSETGVSAIEKAYEIISKLKTFAVSLNDSRPKEWESVLPVHFNVGTIQGGEWPGAVASKCEFVAQMSFLPPFNLASFRETLQAQIASVELEHPARVDFFDLATEPVSMGSNSEFLNLLDESCQHVFKKNLTRAKVTGWCDIRHFSLFKPTPACLFGPGKGMNCHRPDEYFEVGDLVSHGNVLLNFIQKWCGTVEQ